MEESCLRQLDGIVYVSSFMRKELCSRVPVLDKTPSLLLPNFIKEPDEQKANMHADIICIGTLEPRKKQQLLSEALLCLHKRRHRYSLTLVGDGPDRSGLEAFAQQNGLADYVTFMGFVPNGSQMIHGHKLLVHCARMESFGIVLIEALARGVPVVASRVGGMAEIFEHGKQGYYFELTDNAEKVADGIQQAMQATTHPTNELAQRAKQHFIDNYTSERQCPRLINFIQSLFDA